MSELLTCERLVIGHEGRPLLPAFDISIRSGDFVAVVGRNGSGKSTWLKTVLGIIPPVSGAVRRPAGLRTAYVPQSTALDPILPLEAHELVLWGRMRGWSFLRPWASHEDRQACADALQAAEAADLGRVPYGQLSKGQKQRVLFARMLASNAELVLLDEPTAAMDVIAEREAMTRLATLAHEQQVGVVVITHYLGVASERADKVLFLDRDDDEVIVGSAAEVFAHPTFVRRYGALGEPDAR